MRHSVIIFPSQIFFPGKGHAGRAVAAAEGGGGVLGGEGEGALGEGPRGVGQGEQEGGGGGRGEAQGGSRKSRNLIPCY